MSKAYPHLDASFWASYKRDLRRAEVHEAKAEPTGTGTNRCGRRIGNGGRSHLLKGLPGHPLHPPLTDATIGAYTLATAFGLLSVLGISEHNTATAWWLALSWVSSSQFRRR